MYVLPIKVTDGEGAYARALDNLSGTVSSIGRDLIQCLLVKQGAFQRLLLRKRENTYL